jgi:branched-chain amino acid transport system substrate-binding protein
MSRSTAHHRRIRTWAFGILLIPAALALAGCGTDDDSSAEGGAAESIKLGMVLSQSGPIGPFDSGVRWGAEQAISDINAAGGVDGRKIEYVVADNKSEPELAADQTVRFIEEDDVDVLISPAAFDNGGSTAALEASSHGVLSVSGASTHPPAPEASGGLHFDILPSAFSESAAMAELANDEGFKRPITVEDTTAIFFEQAIGAFEARTEELGGEIVGSLKMQYDQPSFASQVSEILRADPAPDLIYLGTFHPAAAKFLREARAAGIDLPVYATEDWDGESWKSGAPVNDLTFPAVGSLYGDDPNRKVNELVDKYEEEHGKLPDTSVGVIGGYDAVTMIAKAIEESGGSTDGAVLTETMQSMGEVELLTGPVSYSEELHVPLVGDERIMLIDDNKTRFVELRRAENAPLPSK